MADSINGSNYGILNWDSPTRVPPNAEQSSLDVSLVSASLIIIIYNICIAPYNTIL